MSRVAPLKFIEPQLASPVDQPPEGKQWIHEIKYDGYRTQAGAGSRFHPQRI
jgi:bifunctional non-homologous end joining protein LigD